MRTILALAVLVLASTAYCEDTAEFFTVLAAATTDPELTDFCRKHFHAAGGDADGREKWRSSRLTLLFPQ